MIIWGVRHRCPALASSGKTLAEIREEAEARNVVALLRTLGREATKKAAAAGTGAEENWGDLGSDAAEPGIPGSGVDWELVEEGVWLSWNMVAAATA